MKRFILISVFLCSSLNVFCMQKAAQLFLNSTKFVSSAPFVVASLYGFYKSSQFPDEKKPAQSEFSPQTTEFVRNTMKEYGVEHPEKISLSKADKFKTNSISNNLKLDKTITDELASYDQHFTTFRAKQCINLFKREIGDKCHKLINHDSQKDGFAVGLSALSSQIFWHGITNRITKPLLPGVKGKIAAGTLHLISIMPKLTTRDTLVQSDRRRRQQLADAHVFENAKSKEELEFAIEYYRKINMIGELYPYLLSEFYQNKLSPARFVKACHHMSKSQLPLVKWVETQPMLLNILEIAFNDRDPLYIKRAQHAQQVLEKRFGTEKKDN